MNKLKSAELMFVRKRFDEIKPHPKNPRVHDDRQIGKLRHSIRVHGFSKGSIVVQKQTGYCLAGHGIIEALKLEGYNGADVVEVDLPDDKALAFLIADNHIADQSTWDDSSLQQLITELSEQNVPSLDFGFDGKDLEDLASRILADSGGYTSEPQDDDIPDEVEPITQMGDLWTLGKHRVMAGDSTKAEDVARLMDGQKADMVFTDPPYGMNLDTDFSKLHIASKMMGNNIKRRSYDKVIGDNEDFSPQLINTIFDIFGYCKEIFLFGADYYSELLPNRKDGSWIVWDKRKENQDEGFGSMFELIWSKQKHKRMILRHDWFGFLSSDNAKEAQNRVHPTQKPTSLLANIIQQFGADNNIILDLFLGSGSTLIACQKLNRVCYGMEISPAYVDVICARWGKFTGERAVRESDGFRFPVSVSDAKV
jgi:DNA modification methylase